MHKTTREALLTLATHLLVDSGDSFRIHAKAARAWRDAGYPDLDGDEPRRCDSCRWMDEKTGGKHCAPCLAATSEFRGFQNWTPKDPA